ncbi:hypothetical protein AN958_02747 [Leucoagaricus sp. SymC.cos]|nr:hypothetical protein AN958_02747 [Leucoagaricus sp. SymC.cos]
MLTSFTDFYAANSAVLNSAAGASLVSLENKSIDAAITGFSESVKVVMNGLDTLGQIHPFIGVAVVAFKLVVTLDLTRRQNNQKVAAVYIEMQQMICTLFQLRHIRDPDEVGPDGMIMKDRVQPLLKQIAQDIKKCGSACDVYLKKSFIAKTLKSKFYEARLTGYVTKFIDYADKLDKALNVHTAIGVDAANKKLDDQSAKLDSIEQKLDVLFRKLDTPQEREVSNFIKENGVKGDREGKRLTGKSGIDSVKEKLRKELSEDLDAVLRRNFSLFDRKLEIQSRNIADALDNVLSKGTHDKIKDKDLSNLWKEMGWKGSVKARHFVLALRDYFTGQFTTGTPLPRTDESRAVVVSPSYSLFTPLEPSAGFVIPYLPGLQDDTWTLEFIKAAHLQAILEAIDDDGTGFISIKEANTFAIERPKGWSLLHWIAFWAKGWEISLADYKNKIFLVLKEMDRLHHQVLKENRYHVDSYLCNDSICGIELLLRSTKTSKDYTQIPHELSSLTEFYTRKEEDKLRLNLENIRYDMDSAATVTLITGPGRIERFLFPLLYLTLKRHLEVFHYACSHVVDSEEFPHMSTTLGSIFDVVEQRIDSLGAIYKQVHIDLHTHLENFALGMFHDFSVHEYGYGSRESLILSWQDTSKTKNESDKTTMCDNPENAKPIFHPGHESTDNYRGVWQNWPTHSFETDDPRTGRICGFWTGSFLSIKGQSVNPVLGLMQLCLKLGPDDYSLLKGFAVTLSGRFQLRGRRRTVEATDEGAAFEQIDVLMWFDDGFTVRFCGKFEADDESLSGDWATFYQKEDAKALYDKYPFCVSPPAREDEGGEAQQDNVGSREVSGDAGSPGGDEDKKKSRISSPETNPKDEVDLTSEVQAVTDDVDDQPSKLDTEGIANDAGEKKTGEPVDGEEGGDASPVDDTIDDTGTFIFRRTPVEIFHFRNLLDKEENQAKARWNFLRESVLHLVRRRLWSWKYIKAWGDDRRRIFDIYKRFSLFNMRYFVIPNPVTPEERLAWHDLKYRLPPGLNRLCIEAGDFSNPD